MPTRLRRRLLLTAALLALLAVGRLLWMQGLIFPVYIAGGSMAPTLLGRHFVLDCEDCGFTTTCDVEQQSATGFAVCPNCGFANNKLNQRSVRPGRRVLIDRAAFSLRRPRRWELVAFHDPASRQNFAVKRVVGLPRERIEIRGGELYQEGRILRKSLAEQRKMAILVHDSSYLSSGNRQPKWASDRTETTGWQTVAGELRFAPRNANHAGLDWLTYRHRSCFASPHAGREWPVLDNYGYNLAVSRELHAVTDLMLRCAVKEHAGNGRIAFLALDGQQAWQLDWVPASGQVSLSLDGKLIAETKAARAQDRVVTVEYSICDDQVLFALDGDLVLEHPYAPPDLPLQPSSRPLAIGASGVSVRIAQLQVFRDIYYLDQNCRGTIWSHGPLAADEYLVLGDNVPISRDSRRWENPAVQHKSLVGQVLSPF